MRALLEGVLSDPWVYRAWARPLDRQKHRLLETLLSGKAPRRVLEVGCGPGNNAVLFQDAEYVGLDLNEKYVEAARHSFPGRQFAVADATLAFPFRGFDVVLVTALLHHLHDDSAVAVLRHAVDSLERDGCVIVLEAEVPPARAPLPRLLMRLDRGTYFRGREAWVEVFRCAGLRVATVHRARLTVCGATAWYVFAAELTPPRADDGND